MKTLRLWFSLLGVLMLLGCPGGPGPIGNLPPVRLTVLVVNGLTNQPIAGARVSLKLDNQNIVPDVASDSNGQAVFENVPAGDGYKAFAGSVPGLAPATSPTLKLEQNSDVLIQMSPSVNQGAGLVAGSVKDARTQSPLAGVRVSLVPGGLAAQGAPRPGAFIQPFARPFGLMQFGGLSAQTDQAGQFTLNDVSPGSYQVNFELSGYPITQRSINVQPGESTTIETVFLSSGPAQNPNAQQGQVLIVESSRVIQLDQQGQTVWQHFSAGLSAATRLPDGHTLVADEQSNQVQMLTQAGNVVWDMGSSLGLISRLSQPGWVAAARDGQSFLISDTGNNRILEIEGGRISWRFETGLNRPRSATYAPNGNIVIADTGNRRVIEVDRQGVPVWGFDVDMMAPSHAVRLEDGSTLITDGGYNRVIRINQAGQPVWFYDQGLNRPRSTTPSRFGTFMIADTGNNRIIEVDRMGQIVSSIPNLGRPLAIERL
ncbi:MAG: carboxypeptidase regulatory-like domain-containing protein [Candidatus Sericytochromatia bacterium]|nr:carboxypeptidase regulatory-like domain-containing protein [Candidatus Sericytochromatia bacterium]